MRTYNVTITGITPLLMHADDVEWADAMNEWKDDPENRKKSKAGDDRTPAWRWIGGLYHDGKHIAMPSDNLMRCMMEGGAMVPVPGGRNGKTFKSQTQSGMMVSEPYWKLQVRTGALVEIAAIDALRKVERFAEHKKAAQDLGFALLVKRARVGASKHIRVRALFSEWSCRGQINVWDEQIDRSVLQQVLAYSGRGKGLCEWRPGGRTPGSFGMFEATVSEVKGATP
jgi:hypothetical protein